MKNFNLAALMGSEDFTDEDYIEQFGLDPALAGKPEINDAILTQVEQNNIKHYMTNEGLDEVAAQRKAGTVRRNTQQQIDRLLAAKGLLGG